MIQAMKNGALADTNTNLIDKAIINNKAAVALYYADTLKLNGTDFSLSSVTAYQSTVTTAKADADNVAAGNPIDAGKTFTLTTAADTGGLFTGSTGNDTFVGTNGTTATLNAGDVLNGGAGTDTLSVSFSGVPAATTAVITTAIENVSISNFATGGTPSIDLTQATGVETVKVTASAATGNTTITGLGNIVAAEMASGSGDLTITYTDAAVVGTTDAQTLTLKGQTAGSFTVAGATTGGVETLNIVSQTAANTVAINDAATATITTINVSGDKNLTLTEGATNPDDAVTTINASTFTGNLVVTTASAAAVMTVTGGTGNDTVTFSADNFTAADTVNGGAGTDILAIATTIAAATDLALVTNVETLKMVRAKNVTLAANTTMTNFDFTDAAANALTLNTGVTNAVSVTLGATGADTVVNSANVALTISGAANAIDTSTTITGGTGIDTINITADTQADAAITMAGVVTRVDVINVLDGGDTTAAAADGSIKGRDVSITTGAYATALTIDASALDAGTVTNSVMGADDEVLTVDGTSATAVLTITGGAGRDNITTGTKNDIVNSGAGNDTITASAASDLTINAGTGDDTINMGATLTSADTINGGEGTDTLSVTTISASALTGVTNVETLQFNGTASLTSNLSFTTIDLTNGATQDSLTFGTGYTTATTVAVDQDIVVNTVGIALTVTGTDAEIAASSITGHATAADSITITAATEGGTAVTATTDFTLVDTITIVDGGDDAASGTNPAGDDIALTLTSYAKALTIDASALDAAGVDNDTDGDIDNSDSSAEKLVITGASSKKLTVTGGSAGDAIVGSTDTADGDTLNGGAGNDTFTMTTNLSYMDTINGGEGTDIITGSAFEDVDFMHVSNVETLTINDTTTSVLSTYFDATGVTTVNLHSTGTAVNAAGTATGHTFVATAAVNETITGGLGNDSFKFGSVGTLTGDDVIVGGSGTDAITIDNSVDAGVTATIDLDDVTGVEQVTLLDANGDDTTTAEADAVSITFEAATTTTAQTITVSAAVVTDTLDTVTVDASAVVDTDYSFNITGGAAIDTLTGSAGTDTISGGADADIIIGGLGIDTLTGGDGADSFAYVTTESTIAGADTISDFTTGTDKIALTFATTSATDALTFDYTNKGTAVDNSAALALLSSRVGQYYFNTTTHQMIMDADGSGLIQATDFAVNMTGMTSIGASDVNVIVTASAAANQTINTGGGADSITISAITTVATVDAGAGNDTIYSGANLGATDVINGGADTDTLSASNTTVTLTTDANLTNVENITLTADSTTLNISGQTEAFTITTANGTNAITTTGSYANNVTGGSGVETLTVDSYAAMVALATVDLNGGTDILAISAADLTIVDAGFTGLSEIETLRLTGASTAVLGANATATGIATVDTGTGATSITSTQTALTIVDDVADNSTLTLAGSANYTITGVVSNITSTSTGNMAVTMAAVATSTVAFGTSTAGTHSVNADALTDEQILTLTGSDAASVSLEAGDLFASDYVGNLTVTATTGSNVITTGAGADIITGGAGHDTISLTETIAAMDKVNLAAVAADSDTITGFATTSDKLVVSAATFDAVTGGSLTAATNAIEFIYLLDTGTLYLNTDAATAGGLIEIAVLGANTTLVAADLSIIA